MLWVVFCKPAHETHYLLALQGQHCALKVTYKGKKILLLCLFGSLMINDGSLKAFSLGFCFFFSEITLPSLDFPAFAGEKRQES